MSCAAFCWGWILLASVITLGGDAESVQPEDMPASASPEELEWMRGLRHNYPVLALPTGAGKSSHWLARLALEETSHVVAILTTQEYALYHKTLSRKRRKFGESSVQDWRKCTLPHLTLALYE